MCVWVGYLLLSYLCLLLAVRGCLGCCSSLCASRAWCEWGSSRALCAPLARGVCSRACACFGGRGVCVCVLVCVRVFVRVCVYVCGWACGLWGRGGGLSGRVSLRLGACVSVRVCLRVCVWCVGRERDKEKGTWVCVCVCVKNSVLLSSRFAPLLPPVVLLLSLASRLFLLSALSVPLSSRYWPLATLCVSCTIHRERRA
jgi:hypothetical protein